MKLINMTNFVLEQVQNAKYEEFNKVNETFVNKVVDYAKFLKQPLELWMFVPCYEDGNVSVEPKNYVTWLRLHKSKGSTIGFTEHEKYQQAKERCLFEGLKFKDVQPSTEYNYFHLNGNKIFEANNQYKFNPCYGLRTIEDLVKYKPELTQTTIKQIGL